MARPNKTSYRIDFSKVFLDPDLQVVAYRENYGETESLKTGDPQKYEQTKNSLKTRVNLEIEKILKNYTHDNCKQFINQAESESISQPRIINTYVGLEVLDTTVPETGLGFNLRAYYNKKFGNRNSSSMLLI